MDEISEFRAAHAFLSNFWYCKVEYKGRIFQSSEAAFQAEKCANEGDKDQFMALTAAKAKRLGRQVTRRADWDEVRVQVMREVLAEKFRDETLRARLAETEDAQLIEGNTWGDTFWGVCKGVGENQLGKLLMELRESHYEECLRREGYHKCPDGIWRRTPSNGQFDGLCGVCEQHISEQADAYDPEREN